LSASFKLSLSIFLLFTVSFLTSCHKAVWVPDEKPANKRGDDSSPRTLASLELTQQGRMLLENGKIDDAITVLERAVSLNPTNGQNYYYLSEAWLLKKNLDQASEFNHLAGIYLKDDTEWNEKVLKQEKRIENRKHKF
jgi:tetratricopeptide (TPR) repeat protein